MFVLTASCVYSFDDWHLTLLPYINFRSPFDLCQCDTDVYYNFRPKSRAHIKVLVEGLV